MQNIKIKIKLYKVLALAFILSFSFISCDKDEYDVGKIFNSNADNSQTLINFESTSYNLEVVINDVGSVDITVNSSTVSTVDRVYSIVLNSEETTADALTYILPSTVTIPAGSYQGTFTINGIDGGLVEITPKQIVLSILEESSFVMDDNTNKVVVYVYEVCPLGEGVTFQGEYLVQQTSAPSTYDDPADVYETQIVDIVATSEFARSFQAPILEYWYNQPPTPIFSFNLICNSILVDSGIGIGLSCDLENEISMGPSNIVSTYDENDDSQFEITFTMYHSAIGCDIYGVTPYDVTLLFTKQ